MPEVFDKGFAVVVGVGNDLPATVNDAHGIAQHLTDPEFCAYPQENVRLLTEQRASKQGILDALAWLADQTRANPDATAIVYFSGHGARTPEEEFFLIPYDRGFRDPNNLANTALYVGDFQNALDALHSKRLLVLLDCCHGGSGVSPALQSKGPSKEQFQELGRGQGRVVIASSDNHEKSYILPGARYSAFTGAVLEALAGRGAYPQDGYARVLPLISWVGQRVPELVHPYGGQQHPIANLYSLSRDFALGLYAGGGATPKHLSWSSANPLVPLPAPVAQALDAGQVELAAQRLQAHIQPPVPQRERLAQRLMGFIPGQFAMVPLYANIPDGILPTADQTQSIQSSLIFRHYLGLGRLQELEALIQGEGLRLPRPLAQCRPPDFIQTLNRLLPAQMSLLIFRANLPRHVAAPLQWAQSEAIIHYMEAQGRLDELEDILAQL